MARRFSLSKFGVIIVSRSMHSYFLGRARYVRKFWSVGREASSTKKHDHGGTSPILLSAVPNPSSIIYGHRFVAWLLKPRPNAIPSESDSATTNDARSCCFSTASGTSNALGNDGIKSTIAPSSRIRQRRPNHSFAPGILRGP